MVLVDEVPEGEEEHAREAVKTVPLTGASVGVRVVTRPVSAQAEAPSTMIRAATSGHWACCHANPASHPNALDPA